MYASPEETMRITVPKETAAGERRVALVPENVARLVRQGHEIRVVRGAGEPAGHADAAYASAGAKLAPSAAAALDGAEVEVNDEFRNADVALVIGANDVVNPAARTDRASPIYGMPILNVDEAKQVVVLKRSMNPGFAGIENELFYAENTSMLFGDAKASLQKLVEEVKHA